MTHHFAWPISTAIRKSLRGYTLLTFKHDFLAALVVSLIALPLSMALSIAVGLPPQHGIYTAIVAGAIVPLLGGSIWQISGPTAAFVVILAPIVSDLGLRGIIWCGLMAGVILIIMGFARLGRLINYVPYPVTTGFTAGIAVVLATLSLNDFLGLGIAHLDGSYIHKVSLILSHVPMLKPQEAMVGIVSLIVMGIGGRIIKFLPSAVTAMAVGIGLAMICNHLGYDVQTIGTRFSYVTHEGQTLAGVPPYPPIFHFPTFAVDSLFTIPSFEELRHLLFPAFAIAILAALESLLSATVADSMAGTRHNPNAELTGIGVGNILSALVAGIPATGAIARTATGINNGAKTPLAASMHAIFIMLYVLILAPYISYVPMAALAALLIHTAYRMSHYRQFIHTVQIAPRSDVIVLLACFILTVFVDMVMGVSVGMVCAAFLLMKRVTDMTHVELEGHISSAPSSHLPHGTMVFRIRGPLFFGTIEKAFDRAEFTHDHTDTLIVDIADVPFIDMTGLVAMQSMLESIANPTRAVKIVCHNPEVVNKIKHKIAHHSASRYVSFHASIHEVLAAPKLSKVKQKYARKPVKKKSAKKA